MEGRKEGGIKGRRERKGCGGRAYAKLKGRTGRKEVEAEAYENLKGRTVGLGSSFLLYIDAKRMFSNHRRPGRGKENLDVDQDEAWK
jgi:hypothetical protein